MNKTLESLLIAGVIELKGDGNGVVLDILPRVMNLILEQQNLFEKVPEKVYISSEELSEIDKLSPANIGLARDFTTGRGQAVNNVIKYFEHKAVMLKDRLHASAYGRMSYIYRSKGSRLYLFNNGDLILLTPYSYIDHSGFQLDNESQDQDIGIDQFDSYEQVQDFFDSSLEDYSPDKNVRFICGDLIEMLVSLKKPFHKDFYLEYLLTPPDVDLLSEFSQKVKHELWDICLSQTFVDTWGTEVQNACMNILSQAGVPPTSGQLVKYIKGIQASGNGIELILNRLNQLESNVIETVKDTAKPETHEIFEMKPNIAGIGINGNELYKQFKYWWSNR
ncbi:hypothetical protein ACEOHO_004601 [Vibrio vulnificus]|nr:hypothetical protein [Vibrio vulnificus]EKO5188181.1 hypothetical protein [Vibrio vulnificus]ELH7808039.1 hypothetical protein [Vibrio vulnificus]MCU8457281.1 hypothetical protein [Vibrio vulnificus]HAS8380345.1 hypothetical protein [Vibrio vulnificus]